MDLGNSGKSVCGVISRAKVEAGLQWLTQFEGFLCTAMHHKLHLSNHHSTMSPPDQLGELNKQSMNYRLPESYPSLPWHCIQTVVQDVEVSALSRLVIVGDTHGHLPELRELLQKVNFEKENGDHLIFVGDLINKGPDSPGVVQLAMDLKASAVRGNNEDRVLAAHAAIKRGQSLELIDRLKELAMTAEADTRDQLAASAERKDEHNSLSPKKLKPYSAESDFGTAAELSDDQIFWLSSLPLILRIRPPKATTLQPWNAGTLLVAHAGLVPSLPLEEQDHWAVMNMRSLVYPDSEASVAEVIRADLLKGAKSRARRYAAFKDVPDEEVKTELVRLLDLVKNGEGFSASYRAGLVGFPLENRDGDWWIDAWNRWQNSIENPEHRAIVVYGHDARVGLQVGAETGCLKSTEQSSEASKAARYTFGLDSGCVYGKSLSAMVVELRPDGKGLAHSIVQVDAIKKGKA